MRRLAALFLLLALPAAAQWTVSGPTGTGGGGGGGASTLDELTDVNTSGAVDGSLLTLSGSDWVRAANLLLSGTQWQVGDGTDGSIKLGDSEVVIRRRSGGGLEAIDPRPTIGATIFRVTSGAADSGGTPLLAINNGSTDVITLQNSGLVYSSTGFRVGTNFNLSGATWQLGSTVESCWANSASYTATKDVGIMRGGVGVAKLTNCAGGYGGIDLGSIKVSGSALGFTHLTGSIANGQVPESAVTQHADAVGDAITTIGGICTVGGTGISCPTFTASGSGPIAITEIAAPGAGGSAGVANFYIDSTTHRPAIHLNGGSAKDLVAAADVQTLTGKTIDGNSNTLQPRHVANCAAETGGVVGEACVDTDNGDTYRCIPSSGACDTAAEWVLTARATLWHSINFFSPGGAGFGTAQPQLVGCQGSGTVVSGGQYVVEFSDSASDYMWCNFILPSFVDDTVAPVVLFAVGGPVTSTGHFQMSVKIGCYTGSSDAWPEPDWGSAQPVTCDKSSSVAKLPVMCEVTPPLTGSNWTAGQACAVFVQRLGSDGADDLTPTGDAYLMALEMEVPQ
ncbi:MAG: hypothetical protein GC160_02975 [Acidobacteria bacterium]|nr:hypothetical protein [Acidobacteriota bacterium]